MTTVFPYERAQNQLTFNKLVKNIFKLDGQERKNAMLQLSRYAEQHNVNYDQLVTLFNKNVSYYQSQFTTNNPNLTNQQVVSKQKKAFESSVTRAVSQNIVNNIKYNDPDKQFVWLPSSAEEPRDTHQQFYGNIYYISNPPLGVLPGEDYNCQCGMKILD